MGLFTADVSGQATPGVIIERDPPGEYMITAVGQTSGRSVSTQLQVT
jgi:hypothetical protein